MPTFVVSTLGCKVNQYESQYVREGLERLGFREAGPGEKVDICIVNTCTVTAESDLKSRKIIRQYARRHPEAAIVVMGCYAARTPEELAALPGVSKVIPNKADLPLWLGQLGLTEPAKGIHSFGTRHRAFVKVQDGCRQRCSYCIIPLVRPELRSRPPEEVLEEIQRLVSGGYRELVLTGIHLGQYGVDLPPPRIALSHLLERILREEGEFRIRLSSLEAVELTPELLRLMQEHSDRLCPHLHLPLQSGSDRILHQMGRPYRLADFLRLGDQVRSYLDEPALTTDVMVGFPGETEEDFQATCRAVETMEFAKLHVFPFSPRPGTKAALLADRVPPQVVRSRCAELAELGDRLRRRYFQRLVGQKAQVLVEEVLLFAPDSLPLRRPISENEQICIPSPISPPTPEYPPPATLLLSQKNSSSMLPGLTDFSGSCREGREQSPVLLRGTSERYAPVLLAGPRSWTGRLVSVSLQALFETPQEPLLWADSRHSIPERLP